MRRPFVMQKNDDFYSAAKWRHCAARAMSRANYQDKVAARYGKMIQAEMVHHALPLEDFPEYAYDPRNLVPVSRGTHRGLHLDDGGLSKEGVNVARRAARQIGIDVENYLAAQGEGKRKRNDHGRYAGDS